MPEPSVPRVLVLLAFALAACSTPYPAGPSVDPSFATGDFVVVAIGDSVPYNLDADCPGCSGFIYSYATALEAELGEPVAVRNRSRHDGARTSDIVDQLASDENLRAELRTADVIVISVGFNDQPPSPDAQDGCPDPVGEGDTLETVVERVAASGASCLEAMVQATRAQVADVFAAVREQAPDAAIGALTPYDTWLGWSALDPIDESTRNDLHAAIRDWMHGWRDALCAEAEAVGATCIDVYSAFNGPDGTQPPTDFVAADHTHPSQRGNDVIRDLLLEADLAESAGS